MEFHPEANHGIRDLSARRIDSEVARKARTIVLNVSEKFNHVGF
jgi:hypothetical protein